MNNQEQNEIRRIFQEELEKANHENENSKSKSKKSIYTRKEVLGIFDICETTLFLWKRAGKIKAHTIGRRVFFKHEDIMDALGSQSAT